VASALVVNASPLILFARIDRLDLLVSLSTAGLRLKPTLMDEALAKVGE
jgi:hypothetical protein